VKRIFTQGLFTLAMFFAAFTLIPFQYIQANELSAELERDANASENVLRPMLLRDSIRSKCRYRSSNATFVTISDIPSGRTSLRACVNALSRQGFLANFDQLHRVLRI
jgi:hypothetical protein